MLSRGTSHQQQRTVDFLIGAKQFFVTARLSLCAAVASGVSIQQGESSPYSRQCLSSAPTASVRTMPSPKKKGPRRFTNGHKCFTGPEAKFITEIIAKETDSRDSFVVNLATFKKPRDPTNGELTSRDDAPYIMPLTETYKNTLVKTIYNNSMGDTCTSPGGAFSKAQEMERSSREFGRLLGDVSKVEALRRRKEEIDSELNMLKGILEHKKAVLSITKVV